MMKTYESLRHPGTYIHCDAEADLDPKTKTVMYLTGEGENKTMSIATLKRWWKEVADWDEQIAADTEALDAKEPKTEEPAAAETEEPMSMSETIKTLEMIFDKLNARYFGAELPKPVITVQSTPKAYGHCTTKKIWKDEDHEGQYEINIGAEYLNRPIENTSATLLHEMVHLYCLVNSINDTCQNGRYHNGTFKAEAEKRDLSLEYDRANGWTHTQPSETLKANLIADGINQGIKFARVLPVSARSRGKMVPGALAPDADAPKRNKSWKYICPCCGQMVRSTNENLNLICGNDNNKLERV